VTSGPDPIPFNRPFLVGTETSYIEQAVGEGWLSAGGAFTGRCEEWLRQRTGCDQVLLTHSCTAALEAAALLAQVGPEDEVIMPSFTFVSTALAFALRGAKPVFVDIEPETLNIDPARVAEAINPRTRAIVAVHYAGVACEMGALLDLAARHDLLVIEDAAQGLMATLEGRALGSMGQLGTLSFHETKNVTCGEGGALLVNEQDLRDRAEVLWEKGTDRGKFNRGEVDRYTWVDLGSSFGTSEVTAAFLWGQLERAEEITTARIRIWQRYHEAFAELEAEGVIRRPVVPPHRAHNAHTYYLLLSDGELRTQFIEEMGRHNILTVFHYVPLHSSPAGSRLGRAHGSFAHTDDISARLVRLPLWMGLQEDDVTRVIESAREALTARSRTP
jgi:dTDP-4-amino-4,6-dideoxygalactose transaminase